jgi:HK97 family phage prohead protease
MRNASDVIQSLQSGKAFRMGADQLFNRPWFLSFDALQALVARFQTAHGSGYFDDDEGEEETGYALTEDGIACIPVYGPLAKATWWRTTYGDVYRMASLAMADAKCKALLFCYDSPGGEASGMFDLADYLNGIRGTKPIAAISDDRCYSAAYCLASASDRLFVTRTGGAGSIGVWTAHVDMSKMMDEAGIKVTYIFAGDKKVDGNPYEALSDRAYNDLKSEVDRLRAMFVETVARNRNVSVDALLATEAGIYMAADGIPLLADAVGGLDDALQYLRTRIASTSTQSVGAAAPPDETHPGQDGEDDNDVIDAGRHGEIFSTALARFTARNNGRFVDHVFAEKDPLRPGQILAFRNCGTVLADVGVDRGVKPQISGLLVPYNSLSCDMGGFREIYEAGCFNQSLKAGEDDPAVVYAHNVDQILGRVSAGTARFWETAEGLRYSVDVPDTQPGRDAMTLIGRGDIRGSSAAFYILRHRWETRNGARVRVVEQAQLVEGSPYPFPAYTSSTATVSADTAGSDYELELVRARLELLALA